MSPLAIPAGLAGLWCVSLVAFTVIIVREVRQLRRVETTGPVPDPAFRDRALAEDDQWAGVECEWHAFVDSFGVREAQR